MAYIQRPYPITDGGTGATTASGALTNLGAAAVTAVMLLAGTQAMTADMDLGTHKIINVVDPVSAQQAATKNYVDLAVAGIAPTQRTETRVATTGSNITSLTSGAPNVIDGITLQVGDFVLVKDQTTASQNGIYIVNTVGTGSNGVWARASQMSTSAQITPGLYSYTGQGTTNAGAIFMLSTDEPYTIGTTSLNWIQVNGAFDVLAGNGLTKTGNTLSVLANGTTITVGGSGISVNQANLSLGSIGGSLTLTTQVTGILPLANGGTNSGTASGARSNLAAAPNVALYWVGSANGELANGIVPTVGSGLTLTATTGVFGIDTAVVLTASNAITATGKTFTAPKLNGAIITFPVIGKTATYIGAAADNGIVTFNISSAANYTLPASSGITTGWRVTVKNKKGSSASVSCFAASGDTGENSTMTSSTAYPYAVRPGDAFEWTWDGSEWILT